MDQVKMMGMKPCIVKLTRFNGEDPEVIRERILDRRTRNCHVLVHRFNMTKYIETSPFGVYGQHKVRRCCVRLPKLNVEDFESSRRSSPAVFVDGVDIDRDNGAISDSF